MMTGKTRAASNNVGPCGYKCTNNTRMQQTPPNMQVDASTLPCDRPIWVIRLNWPCGSLTAQPFLFSFQTWTWFHNMVSKSWIPKHKISQHSCVPHLTLYSNLQCSQKRCFMFFVFMHISPSWMFQHIVLFRKIVKQPELCPASTQQAQRHASTWNQI